MKKIQLVAFLFLYASFYSQNISDYSTIYIPKQFSDQKANKYNLNEALQTKLKAKKFVINNENTAYNCDMLKAEITNNSNMFTNKVIINFTDCNNKTIATLNGKSSIKEIEEGMHDAINMAIKGIGVASPVAQNRSANTESVVDKTTQPEVSTVTENTVPKTSAIIENKAEIFSNGIRNLNKIVISNNQFILVNPNNSTPFAIFKESTKKEVYRVQLQDGTQTLGYLENGKIVVEIPNQDGSYKKEIFSQK